MCTWNIQIQKFSMINLESTVIFIICLIRSQISSLNIYSSKIFSKIIFNFNYFLYIKSRKLIAFKYPNVLMKNRHIHTLYISAHVPKCMSCHKAIVVITGMRFEHCVSWSLTCMYVYIYYIIYIYSIYIYIYIYSIYIYIYSIYIYIYL